MTKILVVPVYLDALVLDKPTAMVEAFADFSRTPYFNGERDVNPDTPNLSEEILSQPFENQNLYLERGVHLHWSLPDALTRGSKGATGKTEFPAVPNRWLISRLPKGSPNPDMQWVVESDFVYLPSASESNSPPGITYPTPKDTSRPFGYLGRCLDLTAWQNESNKSKNKYLDKLTAVGYGEPAFAAFYPNCHSVFGFWDNIETDVNKMKNSGIAYEVLGWYSNGGQDFLSQWIQQFTKDKNKTPSLDEQLQALKDSSSWINKSVLVSPQPELIRNMVCYARIEFTPPRPAQDQGVSIVIGLPDAPQTASGPVNFPVTITGAKTIDVKAADVKLKTSLSARGTVSILEGTTATPKIKIDGIAGDGTIGISSIDTRGITAQAGTPPAPSKKAAGEGLAIGNTSTEALSAYLAGKLSPDDTAKKSIIEDQLETLHLTPGLEKLRLDISLKFKEARHSKGFRPVTAGHIWTLRPESNPQADQMVNRSEQVTLPLELAELLNTLNDVQQAYDKANFEIESLRSQLFADWYKYMLCAYPPLDTPDDYPNIDEVKEFIEANYLDGQAPLQKKMAVVGKVYSGKHTAETIRTIQQNNGNVEIVYLDYDPTADKRTILYADPPATDAANAGEILAIKIRDSVKALLGSDAMSGLQKVVESDIADWDGFAAILDQSNLLTNKYSPLPQRQTSPEDREKEIVSLLKDLNDLVFQKHTAASQDLCRMVEDAWKKASTGTQGWADLSADSTKLIKTLKTNMDLPVHAWMRLNRLLLESLFPQFIAHRPDYLLKRIPAPRYWEPNDPVVLLAGDAVNPTDRHGPEGELQEKGLLVCGVVSPAGTLTFDSKNGLDALRDAIQTQAGTLGRQDWMGQPWNPIMLEWEVEFFPAGQGGNRGTSDPQYDPNYIVHSENYKLPDDSCDFDNAAKVKVVDDAKVYSGRSILTAHARNQLKLKLEAYLSKEVLGQYYKDKSIPSENQKIDMLGAQIGAIRTWYEGSNGTDFNQPAYTAIRAYELLQNTDILAQSLGGFNQALLMHKQTLQLPIDDPLGFKEYQDFTNLVAASVGRVNSNAPQPLNDFSPIRAGRMELVRLRLIDTFGQVRDIALDGQTISTSETLPPSDTNKVSLPPRLAQAARLNFRWLAAGNDEAEMNDHPATSPICGWILPNNLDDSLMVYEPGGQALGSLDASGWRSAPGRYPPVSIIDIPNPHLRKLIKYLYAQGSDFFDDFLTAIENALENIDPENFAQHEALALLMGRPIAVVRASLNLELRGRPAVNQDWNTFRQDMQGTATQKDSQGIDHLVRTTDGFTNVDFSIRIGEFEQLNDGLIGYWVEGDNGYEDDKFYAPQTSDEIDHPNIRFHQENDPAMIQQSIDDPSHKLTMLLDPRGVVHATCGILPTKAIQIPPDQFADALRAIEVTFLTAPVLTDIGKINLPLPDEPGYQWSWLEKESGIWADETAIGPITTQATFASKQAIREGWLKLRPRPDQKTR
jgi:hypothetical protein